jgi:hypothetical protein
VWNMPLLLEGMHNRNAQEPTYGDSGTLCIDNSISSDLPVEQLSSWLDQIGGQLVVHARMHSRGGQQPIHSGLDVLPRVSNNVRGWTCQTICTRT